MEKPPTKSKGNSLLFKYLHRPASFAVPNPPFSPGRRRRTAFSGPILPTEAARNNHRKNKQAGKKPAGTPKEPSSPKVSCIGQIKMHSYKDADKHPCKGGACRWRTLHPPPPPRRDKKHIKLYFAIKKMFRRKVRPSRKQEEEEEEVGRHAESTNLQPPAPVLGQMRRFTSGREGLAGFDWMKAQKVKDYDHGDEDDEDDEEEVKEKVIISHSGPILMGGGEVAVEPKKEINIWKRRTAAPPMSLQLS